MAKARKAPAAKGTPKQSARKPRAARNPERGPGWRSPEPLTQKQAWDMVSAEVRAGRMLQPGTCATCDAKEKLWGHHWRGYDYPCDVWWVCSSCNRLLDVHDGSQTLEAARVDVAAKRASGAGDYERHKADSAARSRRKSEEQREIGMPEPPVDPERKARCRGSLAAFCREYLPDVFPLAWAPAHLEAIQRLQVCATAGGQFAFAMPRGMGKTKLCEAGALWSLLYGHRRFVVLIGSSSDAAEDSLESIKLQLETNDRLNEDFREVTKYVRALEGISQRANAQTINGERARLGWKGKKVIFPTVPGAACSGSRIRIAGVTGRLRGLSEGTATGESIRPDLAICDDPQKDENADSPAGIQKIERLINGAVLGMAGPKKRIAAFVPCTVIRPDDVADRLTDRERSPVWNGQRARMVDSFPSNLTLWDRYSDLRKAGQRLDPPDVSAADELYRANRAAMDEGAALSWPERFNDSEQSAVQHAMNLLIDRGRDAFFAEYQNEPIAELAAGQLPDLVAAELAARVNGMPRGVVPPECSRLSAFIDCGKEILWWAVAGWSEDFGGAVIDYGTYPKQHRTYFARNDPRPKLADLHPGLADEALLYAGLKTLTADLLGRDWQRHGGGTSRIGLCLVDSGYLSKPVAQLCRQSPLAGLLAPSKGFGVTHSRPPMDTWGKRDPGERKGDNWRQRPDSLVVYDTNHWKTFLAARLTTPEGGRSAVYLPAGVHEMFTDHLCAEQRRVERGHGREVTEWSQRVGRDNDWLDCAVGCAVAASVLGVKWDSARAAGEEPFAAPARKKIRASEVIAAKLANKRAG
jgi:hypothetical protein